MLSTRWIRSLEQLDNEGARYDDFIAGVGDIGFFYQREWIRAMLDAWALGPDRGRGERSLAFVLVEEGGRILSIAPFQLERKGASQLWLQRLYFLGEVSGSLSNGTPDILVVEGADRRGCLGAIGEFLMSQRELRWDRLELGMLPADSPNGPILSAIFPEGESRGESLLTPWVDLSAGHDAYLEQMDGKLRREIRRCRRRLEEQADYRFEVTDVINDQQWAAMEQVHRGRQAAARREGRRRYSLFEDPVEGGCFERAIDWTNRAHAGRHYWLWIEGQLAAFGVGFPYGETYYFYLMAFDEQFHALSPSRLLLDELIREEARRETRRIDMLPGLNLLKQQFATEVQEHIRLAVNRPSPGSRLRVGWRKWAKSMISRKQ